MKKTILITLSMLAVFSVLLAVSANQLTDSWQTPQQDAVSLTVQSPVEMVEKEYKEYKYVIPKDNPHIIQVGEGMITYAQAASAAGSTIDKIFPQFGISDEVPVFGLFNYDGIDLITYEMNLSSSGKSYSININPYTGRITNIYMFRRLDDIENIAGFCPEEMSEEFLKEKLVYHCKEYGYTNPIKLITAKSSFAYPENDYVGNKNFLMFEDETVLCIDWAYCISENYFIYSYSDNMGELPLNYEDEFGNMHVVNLKEHIKENGIKLNDIV